jgi:hypothetical protein
MKAILIATLLFGTTLIFASSVRATSVRTGSSYGQISSSETSDIGTQSLVPLTPISTSYIDLLLQIGSGSPYLGDPIKVTAPLVSSFISGTDPFGILGCGSDGTAGSTLGTVCTPMANPTCDLSGVTYSGGSLTLPGSCIVVGETFYFDESTSGVGTFATLSPVTSTPTPEPSGLALLGIGLIPLAFLSNRRLQARS